MWPSNQLTDLLGIDLAIIQAPMAGTATPALAAEVSNAGALAQAILISPLSQDDEAWRCLCTGQSSYLTREMRASDLVKTLADEVEALLRR